jgi:hypothetical protein
MAKRPSTAMAMVAPLIADAFMIEGTIGYRT